MYNNVGSKIKGVAMFIGITCLVVGIIIILGGIASLDSTSTGPGSESTDGMAIVLQGLGVIIGGFIGFLPLYGFGELIEKVTQIVEIMEGDEYEDE